MNHKKTIVITILSVLALCYLTITIVNQQKQINKLQEQLQHETLKYRMLYRDPIVRKVIESGGWLWLMRSYGFRGSLPLWSFRWSLVKNWMKRKINNFEMNRHAGSKFVFEEEKAGLGYPFRCRLLST